MDKAKIGKVAGAVGAGLLLVGAGIGGTLILNQSEPVEVVKEVIKEVPIEVEKIVEVPVEVEKEVLVDNGNLNLVLEYLQENFDKQDVFDVDDDEVELIVDNIVFENDAILLAEQLVKEEGLEFLDDEEDMFGEDNLEEYRDNDVYKFDVDKDDSEIEDIDFEDKEAEVSVVVRMKLDNDDDKISQYVRFFVEVEGDKAEIIDAELVE